MMTRAPLHVLLAQIRADGGPDYALQLCEAITDLRAELERCAHPVSGDLALMAAAANDGLLCEPTLGIDNIRRQLLAIRETGHMGTERAAIVLAQAVDDG